MTQHNSYGQTANNSSHQPNAGYSLGAVLCGLAFMGAGYLSTTKFFTLKLIQYLVPSMKAGNLPFTQHAPVLMPIFRFVQALPRPLFQAFIGIGAVTITVMWSMVYFLLGTAVYSLITKGRWRKEVAIAITFNVLVLLLEPSLRYSFQNLGLGNTFLAALMIPTLALLNFYLNHSDPLSNLAFKVMYCWSMIACNLVSIVTTTTNANVGVNLLLSGMLFLAYLL